MDYTAIIEKSDDGYYVGQLQEIPEVIAQGKTIDELNQNLLDALQLVIDYHREHTISKQLEIPSIWFYLVFFNPRLRRLPCTHKSVTSIT